MDSSLIDTKNRSRLLVKTSPCSLPDVVFPLKFTTSHHYVPKVIPPTEFQNQIWKRKVWLVMHEVCLLHKVCMWVLFDLLFHAPWFLLIKFTQRNLCRINKFMMKVNRIHNKHRALLYLVMVIGSACLLIPWLNIKVLSISSLQSMEWLTRFEDVVQSLKIFKVFVLGYSQTHILSNIVVRLREKFGNTYIPYVHWGGWPNWVALNVCYLILLFIVCKCTWGNSHTNFGANCMNFQSLLIMNHKKVT